MRAVFKPTDYQPQFKVSKRRAWYRRLTPLALFCLSLAVVGLIGTIAIAINLWGSDANGTQRMRSDGTMIAANLAVGNEAAVAPAATLAPVAIIASNDPANNAQAVAPVAVIVQQPANIQTGDGLNSGSSVVSSADAQPVQYAQIPWAGKLTKGKNGGWTAPPEVVDQLVRDIKAYYKVMRDLEFDDYLAQRDLLFASYFDYPQIQTMKDAEDKRQTYELNRDGEVSVSVLDFTEKGNRAEVQIFTKGWVDDIVDFHTKDLLTTGQKQPDQRLDVRMRYDAIEGRWKFEEVLRKVELKSS